MFTLSLLDARTLFASTFGLAVIFAALFATVSRVFPYVRGMRPVAWSYLLAIPGIALLSAHGSIPLYFSAVLGNACNLASFALLYQGVSDVCGSRPRMLPVWTVSAIAIAVTAVFSVGRDEFLPRVMAVGLATALIRAMTANKLFRCSNGPANSIFRRLFGSFLALLAVISGSRVLAAPMLGVSSDFTRGNVGLTTTLAISCVYLCVAGCGFLVIATHELIVRTQRASETDQVSGALNRRGIEDRLQAEVDRSEAHAHPLAVCLLDVDHFKAINDTHGHGAGDAALRLLADTLASCVRGRDHVGRYGGDEFLLVLTQAGGFEASMVADRIHSSIALGAQRSGEEPLSVSIGIAVWRPGDTRHALIERADTALYQAKNEGRNCRRIADAEQREEGSLPALRAVPQDVG